MSASAVPLKVQHYFCETFLSEWKVTNLLNHRHGTILMPVFSPSPNLDVEFRFHLAFHDLLTKLYERCILNLSLIKLEGSSCLSSVELFIELKVLYLDGSIIKEYNKLPYINVKKMDCYSFSEIELNLRHAVDPFTLCGVKLHTDNALLINCRMVFFGHLQKSTIDDLSLLPVLFGRSLRVWNNFRDDIECLKRSDEFSDVVIRFASKLFLAHKAVLARHSPVLKQMIVQKPDDHIIVTDDRMYPDVFDSFLNYLYSGEFEDNSWPMVRDVYILSAKYKVDLLKGKCIDAIIPLLSVDKICDVLKIAYEYDDAKLKESATTFTVEHIKDVTSSKDWKKLIASHPHIGYEVLFSALKINDI